MKKAWMIALACVLALLLAGCSGKDIQKKANDFVNGVEDKLDGVEDELTGAPADEPDETPQPEPAPADAPAAAVSDDTVRPEIKEAIDSYEAFFDEYVEFMASYDSSDLSALTGYLSMMQQYTDTMQKLDDMEDDDLTSAELTYYTQAMLRIDQKLVGALGEMDG